jgi:hypothetical protein
MQKGKVQWSLKRSLGSVTPNGKAKGKKWGKKRSSGCNWGKQYIATNGKFRDKSTLKNSRVCQMTQQKVEERNEKGMKQQEKGAEREGRTDRVVPMLSGPFSPQLV